MIDEFFVRYYGNASTPMKKVYETIEKIYAAPAPSHQNEQYAWTRLGTEKTMAKLDTLMNEARMAAQTKVEKQRVALFDKGIWRYMLAGRKAYLDRK